MDLNPLEYQSGQPHHSACGSISALCFIWCARHKIISAPNVATYSVSASWPNCGLTVNGLARMSDKLRAQVWERDKGICQICGKKLIETVTINPSETVAQELSEAEEVPIFKWYRKCWKCRKETPVVSYDFVDGYSYNIGDIDKLDRILMQKYSFVKETFSKTMEQKVIGNTCIHCGSLQGNWFVMEDLDEMKSLDEDLSRLVDTVLQVTLTSEDLNIGHERSEEESKPQLAEVQVAVGHVHHKDGNWENNDLSNLTLVCEDCHHKLSAGLRKIAPSRRTRKQAREERRRKKEELQTDEWRTSYYAQKSKASAREKQKTTGSRALADFCTNSTSNKNKKKE